METSQNAKSIHQIIPAFPIVSESEYIAPPFQSEVFSCPNSSALYSFCKVIILTKQWNTLARLIIFVAFSFGVSGCSKGSLITKATNSATTVQDKRLTSNELTNSRHAFSAHNTAGGLNGNTNHGEIVSSLYALEGEITKLTTNDSVLQTMTIKCIRPLPTAKGTYIPFRPADPIVIYFDEPLSKARKLGLANGRIVRLFLGQVELPSTNPTAWGSSFAWLTVEKNGFFYAMNGDIVQCNTENTMPEIDKP